MKNSSGINHKYYIVTDASSLDMADSLNKSGFYAKWTFWMRYVVMNSIFRFQYVRILVVLESEWQDIAKYSTKLVLLI